MSDSKRKAMMWGGVAFLCIFGTAWGMTRPAKVRGSTPEKRIDSITRMHSDKPRGYVEAITDAAKNDPDPDVRRVAVICLTGNRTPEVQAVVAAAAQDDDGKVRVGACRTMMGLPDQATVEMLVELAKNDPDPKVRHMAFKALAGNKDPHALVALMAMVEFPASKEMREEAAMSLIDKLNMSYDSVPESEELWEEFVEGIKLSKSVVEDYKETGTPMVHDEAASARIAEKHGRLCHGEGEPPRIETP